VISVFPTNRATRPNRLHPKPAVRPDIPAPSLWAAQVLGFQPDPSQARILDTTSPRVILCCTRQWGKTAITAIRALHQAYFHPQSHTVIVAPELLQARIMIEEIESYLPLLQIPVRRGSSSRHSLLFPNGSSIQGVSAVRPDKRGFRRVSLLIFEEASYISRAAYIAARPFLATTNGTLWLLSTPNGQSGFFSDAWHDTSAAWTRFSVPATQCPRISAEFLAAEEHDLGPAAFAQEYLCQFLAGPQQWISRSMVDEAITDAEPHPAKPLLKPQPLHPAPLVQPSHRYFVGLDLGFSKDPTALVVLEEITRLTGQFDHIQRVQTTETVLVLRHVQAYPLRTPYREVPTLIARTLDLYPAKARKQLAVDATGVGLPLVEQLRDASLPLELTPIAITSGQSIGNLPHATTVPRNVLLHNLRRVFEMSGLRIPANLPGVDQLREELVALGNPSAGRHDDLAFALALALWIARPGSFVGECADILPGAPVSSADLSRLFSQRRQPPLR